MITASSQQAARRWAVVALALLGAALATYLTLFQWHVSSGVWDPFFGSASSEAVLTSPFSRALPLPDATLGALGYLAEAVLAALVGADRSSSTPWLRPLFSLVVVGMALVALALVLTQLFLLHTLCTLCLTSAAISFINLGIAFPDLWRNTPCATRDTKLSSSLAPAPVSDEPSSRPSPGAAR